MTPPSTATPAREWWTRPGVVLPVVGTIALIVALITPQLAPGRFGDQRLSSHLASSLGARVLRDIAVRLGWHAVQRDSLPAPLAADGRTIHAVLAPITPVTPTEAHRYLDAVRGGDALLVVLQERNPLSDSLGVMPYARGGVLPLPDAGRSECIGRRELTPPLWADGRVHLFGVRWLRGAPAQPVVFAALVREEYGLPHPGDAAVGFTLGLGRVAVVADPDLLRNDVLRHCTWGADVIAVHILEWLRAGGPAPRTTLAFDEYHQGFGTRPGVPGVTVGFLLNHPLGRALLVTAIAALILLLAVAARPLRPSELDRAERRDPLEQVDALAHAYERVRATRTVTVRLLHGVRRRVQREGTSARAWPHEDFLDAAIARAPALHADVALVRRALREPIADRDLLTVGAALHRIEHTLTTTVP